MEYNTPFIVLKFPIKENNMIDDIFAKFDGAFAKNTIRAYRSDFIQYQTWCLENGLAVIIKAPPSGEESIA